MVDSLVVIRIRGRRAVVDITGQRVAMMLSCSSRMFPVDEAVAVGTSTEAVTVGAVIDTVTSGASVSAVTVIVPADVAAPAPETGVIAAAVAVVMFGASVLLVDSDGASVAALAVTTVAVMLALVLVSTVAAPVVAVAVTVLALMLMSEPAVIVGAIV